MYSIYNQINNRKVLVYPERVADVTKQIDAFDLTNDQIASTYFSEDIENVKSVTHFEKVEVGEGNFIYHGDNIDVLKTLPDNSLDSVVTDPPYGLNLMGKKWDYDVPSLELWKECYRVLKPGGHLLSFGGSRTYHRMVVKVEDAGFEIRDQIMWVYGSGFPKSYNVGLSIDKLLGHPEGTFEPNVEKLQPIENKSIEPIRFEGFGTALKPAHEPIVMARKPFKATVANNILKWSTGGINIEGCKIESIDDRSKRFPANIIFDEATGEILDKQFSSNKNIKIKAPSVSKFFYCPKPSKKEKEEGLTNELEVIKGRDEGQDKRNVPFKKRITPTKNTHTTVKPVALMQYLIKLVTPLGGTTLDPFFGSGTTGKSALVEFNDYKFIGIEKEKEYFDIAVERCQYEFNNSIKVAA